MLLCRYKTRRQAACNTVLRVLPEVPLFERSVSFFSRKRGKKPFMKRCLPDISSRSQLEHTIYRVVNIQFESAYLLPLRYLGCARVNDMRICLIRRNGECRQQRDRDDDDRSDDVPARCNADSERARTAQNRILQDVRRHDRSANCCDPRRLLQLNGVTGGLQKQVNMLSQAIITQLRILLKIANYKLLSSLINRFSQLL